MWMERNVQGQLQASDLNDGQQILLLFLQVSFYRLSELAEFGYFFNF